MRLTTRSCRLGDTISGRMKQWRSSGSTAGYVIGLPAFGLCGVESTRDGRRHHRTGCRLPRQSNSGKTHLATGRLTPSIPKTSRLTSRPSCAPDHEVKSLLVYGIQLAPSNKTDTACQSSVSVSSHVSPSSLSLTQIAVALIF